MSKSARRNKDLGAIAGPCDLMWHELHHRERECSRSILKSSSTW
jgi:hypothetical protein